jgi:hypothetical protein
VTYPDKSATAPPAVPVEEVTRIAPLVFKRPERRYSGVTRFVVMLIDIVSFFYKYFNNVVLIPETALINQFCCKIFS